jgi:twitching motility protein PilT
MKMMRGLNERRLAERKRTCIPLAVAGEMDGRDVELSALSIDLSTTGVGFMSTDMLPVGSQLTFELKLPSAEEPLRVQGVVSRSFRHEKNDSYFHGATFNPESEEHGQRLQDYLDKIDVRRMLLKAIDQGATDLHLIAGEAPVIRLKGELVALNEDPLDSLILEQLVLSIMTDMQREKFLRTRELDFAYSALNTYHCRANAGFAMGNMTLAIRLIPIRIRSLITLGLPQVCEELCDKRKGLVIVTGPSGSGKSTTLAAMIDSINQARRAKIVCIEDPIEYVHANKNSFIIQRELGSDTVSFADALKSAVRQDPDVIMVGEIRDADSIAMAISAAETGHLVLTTMHTMDAVEAVNRIVDSYPGARQEQVRCQLAECLVGVVAQHLLPRKDGNGRVVATEVLVPTQAIRNMIRSGSFDAMRVAMEMGGRYGMHTMDQSLNRYVEKRIIAEELAMAYSRTPRIIRSKSAINP